MNNNDNTDKEDTLEIFPWNENFETGIEEIDEQHKMLVELLNKLADTLTQEKNHEIQEIFNELAIYADFHFKCEEKIWKKYIQDTSLVESHKNTHDSFLPKILELQNKNKNKSVHHSIEEILLFLIRWLAFHIIDEDRRLAIIIKMLNEGKDIKEATFIAENLMSGSMKSLIETILFMYDNLSVKAINLIRERKARLRAQNELKKINKELEKLSITDQLTQLYNRRYFEEVFHRELNRAKRNKTNLGVMSLDIDYFKKLNDTYGHLQGDKALQSLSKCLKNVCKRPNDFIFRIGGEEFCIIVTNENKDSLMNLAKLVHKNVEELKIENKNSTVSSYLTISSGLLSLIPQSGDSNDSIMKLVDDRLYIAKEKGRNQICM